MSVNTRPPGGDHQASLARYLPRALPETVFLDMQGLPYAIHIGPMVQAQLHMNRFASLEVRAGT